MEKKSVRVRSKNVSLTNKLDIKLTIYEATQGSDDYIVNWQPSQYTNIEFNYKLSNFNKKDIKKFEEIIKSKNVNKKNKKIIDGFNPNNYRKYDIIINDVILKMGINNSLEYEIVQDPWTENGPIIRNFGVDPYYLNNGAEIIILWEYDGDDEINSKTWKLWSDELGNELDKPKSSEIYIKEEIKKKILIHTPESNITENATTYFNNNGKIITLVDGNFASVYFNNDAKKHYYTSNQKVKSEGELKKINGLKKDINIINDIISFWKREVPDYNNLKLCEDSQNKCIEIKYISPISNSIQYEGNVTNNTTPEETIANNNSKKNKEKKKLSVFYPKGIQLRVNEDLTYLKIFTEDDTPEFNYSNNDSNFENLLDEEYQERTFDGLSETEYLLQNDIADGQINSIEYVEQPGEPVKVKKVTDLDSLLKLAGNLAREFGKNKRVNYQNLKSGYIKGVHGLCPQGTLCVLAALTGDKRFGKISGHGDSFSFSNRRTSNITSTLIDTGLYNDKVRIQQINGSWKKTYVRDSSLWQVGDVVSCGYKEGYLYGHIQVWTGYKWVSDFTQNNIQTPDKSDPNSFALWRLNDEGLKAVKKQFTNAVV